MKWIKNLAFTVIVSSNLLSCIGEDILDDEIEEKIRISTVVMSLEIGTTFQLEAVYNNQLGEEENADFNWLSSNEDIISISPTGFLEALTEGNSDITVSIAGRTDLFEVINITANDKTEVLIKTERTGTAQTTSSYALSGDFSLVDTGSGLELRFAENFVASNALPGLYVYLTNNITTNTGALEIAPITQFTGEQTFAVSSGTGIDDYSHILFYCKPFSVKVGDGAFEN